MFRIIKATVDHAPLLGKIHATSWQTAYAGIVEADYLRRFTPQKRTAYFEKALTQGWEEDFIIYVNDQPAGFVCLGACRDEDHSDTFGEIWGMYLHPSFWRQGAGSYLMQWALNDLASRGYQTVSLWVLEKNASARKFYERCGFKYDGTIKPISIGHVLNEVRYERSLSEDLLK